MNKRNLWRYMFNRQSLRHFLLITFANIVVGGVCYRGGHLFYAQLLAVFYAIFCTAFFLINLRNWLRYKYFNERAQ